MERNSKQRLRFLKADGTQEPDLHRCAAILTLLVFLWGVIAILVAPWEPFWVPNLVQAIVGGAGVLYFLRTWRRPDRSVDESVCIFLIVYALVMVPWTAVM